ncbi:hypothetical protein [Priestia endophytica]|uniref:hypothetical protein n=1 Tax=Priestia endophytica TaxID=135735 RepID=UPI001F5B7198|nr:hypothetical protein [Priestia endophytica]
MVIPVAPILLIADIAPLIVLKGDPPIEAVASFPDLVTMAVLGRGINISTIPVAISSS